MNIQPSDRLSKLGGYAFAEVDKIVANLKNRGIKPIDFGVGDPLDPTPDFIRQAIASGADLHSTSGYPSYIGSDKFRKTIADWMNKRFGVNLDPATEVSSTLGSKEAIFNFPEAIINPGDIVIIPSPGYPPMKTGTIFAEGIPYYVPLLEENDFLVDFEGIPSDIADKAKIIWINYPNSPTGVTADKDYYEKLIAWTHKNNIIIAADEGCYIDIYFEEKPMSILEVAKEGIITFYSLSKRNNMTGYRVGWVAGDERIVDLFKKLKTNIDSGTPNFVQEAAIAALNDENHAQEMRDLYRNKRDILIDALMSVGLDVNIPEATFYLWQKAPDGMDSMEFAKRFLTDNIAVVVTPGSWISYECKGGLNPGTNYVRFALVPTLEEVRIAAERIRQHF